jgi:tetratricopeptide (TPR) repeat protein
MSLPQLIDGPSMLKDTSSDIGHRLLSTMNVPTKVVIDQPKVEFDCRKEIEKMTADPKKGDTLAIQDLLPADLISADMVDVSILLLSQARQHIEKGEFADALKKLDEFLAQHAGHPEATYLWGLCHLSLDGHVHSFDAQFRVLRAIGALRSVRTNRALTDHIDKLVARIRVQVRGKFLIQFLLVDHAALLKHLLEFRDLDPDCEEYTFFAAMMLLEQEKIEEAYECVEAWTRAARGRAPTLLAGLKSHLESRLLQNSLRPVFQQMKRQDYSGARRRMAAVDARLKAHHDYQLLDAYLQKLEGGGFFSRLLWRGKAMAEVPVTGSLADRIRLQDLIIREEIELAQKHMQEGNAQGAEAAVNKALGFMPDNPYASYLKAGHRVSRVGAMFVGGKLRDFDEAQNDLTGCRALLEKAQVDPDIKGVPQLAQQIDALSHVMGEIQRQIELQREEVRKVNTVIESFMAIMEKAKKGIDSPEMLLDIHRHMSAVRQQVAQVRNQVKIEESRATLQSLAEVIDRNLAALDSMKHAVEEQQRDLSAIEEAGKRFKEIMDSVKNGIGSVTQLEQIESALTKLQADIPRYRQRTRSDAAHKNLDQLDEAIKRNLRDLREAKQSAGKQLADKPIVDEQVGKFHEIVQSIPPKGFSSRNELSDFAARVFRGYQSAQEARNRVHSDGAREALKQIEEQYEGIMKKIG